MPLLHDPATRASIEARINALKPDSTRAWGSMTPDQMLWHVNTFLEFALGEGTYDEMQSKIPKAIMRFMLIYMPWPKGAPTHPNAKATIRRDFEAERKRSLELINRFVSRPIDGPWPEDKAWGKVDGQFASKLQVKHWDHHLRQFSV